MISIDFECRNKHRFEGVFGDYSLYQGQFNDRLIHCPVCSTDDVKRIYSGCSIQSRQSIETQIEKASPTFFETMKQINHYIKENFQDVGKEFPERARAIHYGIEEQRGIYVETTREELNELIDEGVNVFPVVFPIWSRASVLSRTSDGRPLISALPPALSATGP